MTSGPNDPVYDLFLQREITFVWHGKAQAFGNSLVRSVINAANQNHFTTSPTPRLSARAREIELAIDNFILSLSTLKGFWILSLDYISRLSSFDTSTR